jgi:hypothetical protein
MSLKLNSLKLLQLRSLCENLKPSLRLGLIATIIYIGGQFVGCQSRVHERDFQNPSAGRDIKNEIKASGQANKRLEDAQKFLLRIKDVTAKLKDSVPVEINTGLLDDMSSAIEQSSRSLYQFENDIVLFSGELDPRNPQSGQASSPSCLQHHYSIKYNVPEDRLEIVIFHCDSLIQKTVLSSEAGEGKIRIADESVSEQGDISKIAFACESIASRQMKCQNINLGSGADSRWLLSFSRDGVATHVKVDEIEDSSGAIRTRLGFKIDPDGVVTKDDSSESFTKDDSSGEPPKDPQP